jgi:hypothetical protein
MTPPESLLSACYAEGRPNTSRFVLALTAIAAGYSFFVYRHFAGKVSD